MLEVARHWEVMLRDYLIAPGKEFDHAITAIVVGIFLFAILVNAALVVWDILRGE